jgi:hypothetical protein
MPSYKSIFASPNGAVSGFMIRRMSIGLPNLHFLFEENLGGVINYRRSSSDDSSLLSSSSSEKATSTKVIDMIDEILKMLADDGISREFSDYRG